MNLFRLVNGALLVCTLYLITCDAHRICVVDEENACEKMKMDIASKQYTFTCVNARDRIDCMRQVENGTADVVNLPANEAYVAAQNFSLTQILKEEWGGSQSGIMYEGVAVVKKSSNINSLNDLKSKKSCHTGFGRTAGWTIPLAYLQARDLMEECSEIDAASKFFSKSCVPGSWSNDTVLDGELKKTHKHLCQLCPYESCGNTTYTGYTGALRCLVETEADVAFTKYSAVKEFFAQNKDTDKYGLLCRNGSTSPVDQLCYWSARPTNFFMVKSTIDTDQKTKLADDLNKMFSDFVTNTRPDWVSKVFLSSPDITALAPEERTVADALEDVNYKVVIDKPLPKNCKEKYTGFCVTSDLGMQKCQDLKVAAFAQRLRPHVKCHQAKSRDQCLEAIKMGKADIVSADSGDVYAGEKQYDLVPIMAEQYNNQNTSYFAVAVVKANSTYSKLDDLRGAKSCHTGLGRTAGWTVPMGQFVKKGLLKQGGCNMETEAANFFSASCVPGAKNEKLCSLCIGKDDKGESKCHAGDDERYSGYSGAFRCLVEKGDVAFVKHTTVAENTDGKGTSDWNAGLHSQDYVLLCSGGGKKPVTEFGSCNLAAVASHQVITSSAKGKDETDRLEMTLMLSQAAKVFSPDKKSFKMIGEYHGAKDLLFKDSASGLLSIPEGASAKESLGKDLYDDLEAAYCKKTNGVSGIQLSSTLLTTVIFILLSFQRRI